MNQEVRNFLTDQCVERQPVQVINQPVVIDESMITSWNPSTAIEVAFLLLEMLTTKSNAEKVRRLMGF